MCLCVSVLEVLAVEVFSSIDSGPCNFFRRDGWDLQLTLCLPDTDIPVDLQTLGSLASGVAGLNAAWLICATMILQKRGTHYHHLASLLVQ